MKKKKYSENNKPSKLQEPMMEYKRSFSTPIEDIPFMTKQEALENGITLKESRTLIMNKIRQDFAK